MLPLSVVPRAKITVTFLHGPLSSSLRVVAACLISSGVGPGPPGKGAERAVANRAARTVVSSMLGD